jgi:hypothetical protein
MHQRIGNQACVIAAVLAALLGVNTDPARAHRSGAWMYPGQVAAKLSARFVSPACSGRGAYRFTNRSSPNDQQTWLFKHFECYSNNGVGYPGVAYICVHSLAGRRILVTRVMQNNAYRPCQF